MIDLTGMVRFRNHIVIQFFAMKFLTSGLLLFLFAVCAAAQRSSVPPDVTVLENKWSIDKYNPALDKDPLSASKEHQLEETQQKSAALDNENRLRQGEPVLPPVVRQPTSEGGSGKLSRTYVYEIKVRNSGQKEIRQLVWEYVFYEPGTTVEVGRRRFISPVSIKPGATRQIVVRSPTSPTRTRTVDASKAGKKPRDQYSEQVLIRNVGYADGSNWPAPSQIK